MIKRIEGGLRSLASLQGAVTKPIAAPAIQSESEAEVELMLAIQPKRRTATKETAIGGVVSARVPLSPVKLETIRSTEVTASGVAELEVPKSTSRSVLPGRVPPGDTCQAAGSLANRLLTPNEVGSRLGVTTKTLERWRGTGDGPRYVQLSRKILRYTAEDVEAFIRQCTKSSTASI